MILILSSSKTQALTPVPGMVLSQPPLLEQANLLVNECRKLSHSDIIRLMKVSEKLADTTRTRFQAFQTPHTPAQAGAALATFQGDVFSQLATDRYLAEDFSFANRHLAILSGLYGILRPLDLMQPYRLEMGYKMKIGGSGSLYEFWGEPITDYLNEAFAGHQEQTLINCASNEYSRAIISPRLAAQTLTIAFKQYKGDSLKTIAIYAKRARGMFADWYIRNRISNSEDIQTFDQGGYRFDKERSTASEYIFTTTLS